MRKHQTHGSGDVGASDTLNGRVEVVKRLALDDLGADLTANTERGETTLSNDKPDHRTLARTKGQGMDRKRTCWSS